VSDLFRLSRIEAEGWNTARQTPLTDLPQMDETKIASLNPYAKEPERARWSAGFAKALKSWER